MDQNEMPPSGSQATGSKPSTIGRRYHINLILCLALVCVFWSVLAGLQLFGYFTDRSLVNLLYTALGNIFLVLLHLAILRGVFLRKRFAMNVLQMVGILMFFWGTLQLLAGSWLYGCVLPLYLIMTILTFINKKYYPR